MEHSQDEVDVLIIGAGISGISAAYHLQKLCPNKSYAILEARESLGGTWDLFRYPGVRSDSDMYTLGFSFRPWQGEKSIAEGASILAYVRETAEAYGIDRQIRYRHKVVAARWSSDRAQWKVTLETPQGIRVMTSRFLFCCAGYYDYDEGFTPEFPGRERFRGQVVHPQHWSDDVAYEGKRVVVIGSGATAITLVPSLAERASHVTMLQRSPTYIAALPAIDPAAAWLRKRLPEDVAYSLTRWKNIVLTMVLYGHARAFPAQARRLLLGQVEKQLGDAAMAKEHFTPRYDPWDQRLCLTADGDLFAAIRTGRASVATGEIEAFTEGGIRLRSGVEIPADLIITATGLRLKLFGGVALEVDSKPVVPAETVAYKGMMLSGVPNFAFAIGYTNASWTLKIDLAYDFMCRTLRRMDKGGYTTCVPATPDHDVRAEPLFAFSAGYIRRAIHTFPRQGSRAPWRAYQNYALDLLGLRYRRVEDGALCFSRSQLAASARSNTQANGAASRPCSPLAGEPRPARLLS
jgi:monooxygenase